MIRRVHGVLAVACVTVAACPLNAQGGTTVLVVPGFAYDAVRQRTSLGGRIGVAFARTPATVVGLEFGYVGLGTDRWQTLARLPSSPPVVLDEIRSRRVWHATLFARYIVESRRHAHVEAGTGLYRSIASRRTDEYDLAARLLPERTIVGRSTDSHFGVSLGLGVMVAKVSTRWAIDLNIRAHAIFACDQPLYPVISIGAGVAYRPGASSRSVP